MITASTVAHIIVSGEKPQLEIKPYPVLRVSSSLKAETSTTRIPCETNQCSKVCIARNKMPQAHSMPRAEASKPFESNPVVSAIAYRIATSKIATTKMVRPNVHRPLLMALAHHGLERR
jgi:hypothetical protein